MKEVRPPSFFLCMLHLYDMTRMPLETGEIYHIYNRGVEKSNIFREDGDKVRFLQYLYVLNNTIKTQNLSRSLDQRTPIDSSLLQKDREPIVDLLSFALMPNHYHLMLRQISDNGISTFMQRLGTAYTMFFNEKYSRDGVLFQGKYKYKAVTTDAQMLRLPHYIHLNPLKIVSKNEGGPTSFIKLQGYRWSSFPDYTGIKNFPSLLHTEDVLEAYGGRDRYIKDFQNILLLKQDRIKALSSLVDIQIDNLFDT